jgi:diguanylate cyclase (GGDEF)-like protein
MSTFLLSLIVRHTLNIVALSFLLYLLGRNILMSRERVHAYRAAVILTIAVMITECAGAVLDRAAPCWWQVNFAANIIGFSCSALIPFIIAWTCSDFSMRKKHLLLLFPMCIILLCVTAPFNGWIFTVSHGNVYTRGPLFWMYIVNYLIGVFFMIGANYGTASHLARQERRYLLAIYIFFLCGVTVQIILPASYTSWQCITLCLLLYYIFQREIQFRYDPLTGVLNRAAFDKEIQSSTMAASTIIILDVDQFKSINDQHGHVEGDRVLATVGRILQKCFSRCGTCYRIGGDEFAVLCCSGRTTLQASIDKMIRSIQIERTHIAWFPNISYGSHAIQPGESFADAFRKADSEMYQYKRQ